MKWLQVPVPAVLLLLISATQGFVPLVQNKARLTDSKSQIHSTAASEAVTEGLIKTVTKEGKGLPVKLGDIATVKYSCYLPNEPKTAPFSKANQQKVVCDERDF